jgi:hypothetical protein
MNAWVSARFGAGRFFTLVGPPTTNPYAWSISLPDQPLLPHSHCWCRRDTLMLEAMQP